jgi:hypothetical protein
MLSNVAQFKYLGTTVTNHNLIQEEIKRRLNSGNVCCHLVQNVLSSRLLSKNINIRIYKTIIFPVVLYGCETWFLTLRGGTQTGCLRKLYNEELHNLYSSPSIIRMIKSRRRWARYVAQMGGNAYRILVGKPEGKRPLGRLRRRWVDNVKIDLRETGCDGMDWIDLAQDRNQWGSLVNMIMSLQVP